MRNKKLVLIMSVVATVGLLFVGCGSSVSQFSDVDVADVDDSINDESDEEIDEEVATIESFYSLPENEVELQKIAEKTVEETEWLADMYISYVDNDMIYTYFVSPDYELDIDAMRDSLDATDWESVIGGIADESGVDADLITLWYEYGYEDGTLILEYSKSL